MPNWPGFQNHNQNEKKNSGIMSLLPILYEYFTHA